MQFKQDFLPPHDAELEQSILGALLLERDAFLQIANILTSDCFYKPEHKVIFEAMEYLFENNKPIDLSLVASEMRKAKTLEGIGGSVRLTEIADKVASSANIQVHSYKVKELYLQRKVLEYTAQAYATAVEYGKDPFEIIEQLQNDLFELVSEGMKKGTEKIDSVVRKTITQIEVSSKADQSMLSVPSGLPSLDKLIGGFNNTDLIIVAARPAMGKTAFALTIARNASFLYKKKVLFFSIEMSSVQLVMRLMASEAELDSFRIKQGDLEQYEWQILLDKASNIEGMEMYIDDSNMTINDVVAKARRLQQIVGLDMIVVDYLQIISTTKFRGNREQEVAFITRKLKGLAKEIQIPVVALAQLSRATEQRANKKPILSDLRESSSLEMEADIVMFIHREEYYGNLMDEAGESLVGKADIIVAKNRHGAIGDVRLNYKAPFVKFVEQEDQANLFHQDVGPKITIKPTQINNEPLNPNEVPF